MIAFVSLLSLPFPSVSPLPSSPLPPSLLSTSSPPLLPFSPSQECQLPHPTAHAGSYRPPTEGWSPEGAHHDVSPVVDMHGHIQHTHTVHAHIQHTYTHTLCIHTYTLCMHTYNTHTHIHTVLAHIQHTYTHTLCIHTHTHM